MTTILFTFSIALAISIVLTPIAGRVGGRLGAMDAPNARKIHTAPIPRCGGVAIFLAFLTTLFLGKLYDTEVTRLLQPSQEMTGFAIGGIIIFLVGLVDDFRGVGSRTKLVFQIVAASAAYAGGIDFGRCMIGDYRIVLCGPVACCITVFWFLLFINATNLIDGLDGLAGGVTFFASIVMVVLSVMRKDLLMAMMFAGLSGAILGFLRYNFNPASIFLGDGGSYFIGYTIAGLSIMGSVKSQVGAAALIPLIALGVPLFDTVLATVRRFIRGRKVFGADAGHIHHRLLELGLNTRHAVLVLYGVTISLGAFAIILVNFRDEQAGLLLTVLTIGAVIFVRKLGYFEYVASDKLFGWFKDLGDEAGLSKGRRSFLSLQIDTGQAESLDELWEQLKKAFAMLDFDKAMFYPAAHDTGEQKQVAVTQYVDGAADRRQTDRGRSSICMRRAAPEYVWEAERFNSGEDLGSHCLFKMEIPLLGAAGVYLGTMVLIKDKALGALKPFTLRRVEHLRRTAITVLQHIHSNGGSTVQRRRPGDLDAVPANTSGAAACPVCIVDDLERMLCVGERPFSWRKGDLLLLRLLLIGAARSECRVPGMSDADWASAIAAARRHFIAPQLYLTLKHGTDAIQVPEAVKEQLRQLYLQSARRNIRLFHSLGKVLAALRQAEIPVIVLKGAHLGENIYGNISARTLTDVDLLFRKEDFVRAAGFLKQHGFLSADLGLVLDLHWNIDLSIANLQIDMERIWAEAVPATVSGVAVAVLCHEDLLLHLCCHVAFHHQMQFAGLRTLCDIREILKHHSQSIEWARLYDTAERFGVRNAVELTLCLAHDFLSAPIPDAIVRRFSQERVAAMSRRWAMENIFGEPKRSPAFSPYFWEIMRGTPWREKLGHIRMLLFPPRRFIIQKYHGRGRGPLLAFYYLKRFKSHFSRYANAIFRIIYRDEEMLDLVQKQREGMLVRDWLGMRKD